MKNYIKQNIDNSFDDQELPFATENIVGHAGTVFCKIGKVEDKIYFLKKGIVQVNLLNSKGDERIIDFFFPNNFFCSYSSFLNSNPSDVEVIALTDFEVEFITKDNLYKSYNNSILANKLGRIETEKLYLKKVKREKDFLTKTAEEHYLELIRVQSPLLTFLSIDKLAKYLGIHPESLSRIRRKKIKN